MRLSSWSAVLDRHRRRYPLLRAQDIYKLAHQGVFGPGHIISSAGAARRSLREEVAALQVRSPNDECRMPEPRFEPLEPEGKVVRVNLRPLLARGGRMRDERGRHGTGGTDIGWLAEALVESARRVKGDPERMRRRLAAAVRWCRGRLPRQAAALERLAAVAAESGYPALHHSRTYARAYRPAYRVILRSCLGPRLKSSQRAGRNDRRSQKPEPGN
ncbi:MAG TPA: hypothetical protein VMH22_12610 [bacterium]|nr:hypothetical protein [bacterium]